LRASDAPPALLTFDSPIGNPQLALSKAASEAAPAPGDEIIYTLTYSSTNAGSRAFNVRLYDFLPAGVSFLSANPPPASYANGVVLFTDSSVEPVNETATVRVRVEEGYERLYNHALVAADGITPAQVSLLTFVTPTASLLPDLRLAKAGYSVVLSEDELLYTLQCQNTASTTAGNVKVVDVLPTGSSLVSASPSPDLVALPLLQWSVGSLGAGQTWQAAITVTAPSSVGVVTNTALADSQQRVMTQALFATRVVTQANILRVTKTGSASELDVGDELVYTIRYWNDGNQTATGVVLTDTFPADVAVTASVPAPTSLTSEHGVWPIGVLAPDAWGQVVVTLTVGGDAGRVLHNVVDIAGVPGPDCYPGHAELYTQVRARLIYLPLVLKSFQ
jgi:uncharacterized repeat protein (TIGR01451 family)